MKGFSLLGAVITVGIAGALALSIPVLVGANQHLRTMQLQSSQAYYSARGALEFAQRQIRAEGNTADLPTRNFKGSTWGFTRADSTVQVAGLSMTDPIPPQNGCLVVGVSSVTLDSGNNDKLLGVTLSRTSACNAGDTTVSIVSMNVSWTQDSNYKLIEIKINGHKYYDSGPGQGSGSLFAFDSNFTISDSSSYSMDYILWKKITSASIVTMVFNLSDGTSKTVVVSG